MLRKRILAIVEKYDGRKLRQLYMMQGPRALAEIIQDLKAALRDEPSEAGK